MPDDVGLRAAFGRFLREHVDFHATAIRQGPHRIDVGPNRVAVMDEEQHRVRNRIAIYGSCSLGSRISPSNIGVSPRSAFSSTASRPRSRSSMGSTWGISSSPAAFSSESFLALFRKLRSTDPTEALKAWTVSSRLFRIFAR